MNILYENVGEDGMMPLNYEALREMAEERARAEAEALYPPSLEKEREKAFLRLADKYYRQKCHRRE